MNTSDALKTLLDQVDYTKGACGITEMVGAVLPKEVIALCHEALKNDKDKTSVGDSIDEITVLKNAVRSAAKYLNANNAPQKLCDEMQRALHFPK